MDVVLCRKIIETYTEPGETVLDPMSGIFTTGIEACYLGRNAIGVELEEKFVKLSEQNIKLLEKAQTLTPKGKAVVIKGDSRELSRILGEKADAAVFSPPYAESGPWKADGYDDFVKEMRRRTKSGEAKGHYSTPEAELRYIQKAKEGAKVSRDNIGNLPYSKLRDKAGRFKSKGVYRPLDDWGYQVLLGTLFGDGTILKTKQLQLAHSERQKDWLDWKIKKLQPLFQAIPKQADSGAWYLASRKHPMVVSLYPQFYKNGRKVVNQDLLDQIDGRGLAVWIGDDGSCMNGMAIELATCGFSREENELLVEWFTKKWGLTPRIKFNGRAYLLYFGKKDAWKLKHIVESFLPDCMKYKVAISPNYHTVPMKTPHSLINFYGKPVDAVVTSPPFADAEHHYKHGLKVLGKNFKGRRAWEGKERVQSEPENIGKLKYGRPDTVIFSPPYSEGIGHDSGDRASTKFKKRLEMQRRYTRSMKSKENIGSLKYGKPVDAVVTSPPFFSTVQERGYQGRGKHNIAVDPTKHGHKGVITLYAQSRENIDNIEKYGQVDAIVPSPPYANTPLQDYATSNKALLRFEREVRKSFKEKGYYEFNGKRYTEQEWRKINKGELKPRGVPELWRQIISQRKGSDYSEIAHVDAIVTSPPYAEQKKGKADPEKMAERWEEHQKKKWDSWGKSAHTPGRLRAFKAMGSGYSESKRNIGNLPLGQVDAVITSPPYSGSNLGGGNAEARRKRLIKAGHDPKEFLGGKARNAVLKHYDKVDAVITSPPYSESMSKKRKGYTTHPELSETRHMGDDSSDENIGNLPMGKIDSIITSPPYSEGTGHGRGKANQFCKEKGIYLKGAGAYSEKSEGNIGEIRTHGKIDAVVTSPPYEGSLESTSRHTKGGIPARDKQLGQTGFYPSENKENIGSKKGETYLQAMFQIYAECLKTLKPGGKMVLVLKDFVRNKKIVRLDLDTKRLCEAVGFRWVGTKLFRLPRKSFWRVLYERKYPEVDTSLLRFEFVEIFEKPMGACA